MSRIKAEQGYLIMASNSASGNYIACADTLVKSLKHWHPHAKVCLVTDSDEHCDLYDYVVPFPFETSDSDWKVDNDWQAFYASPFRETFKIEADLLVTGPVDHWWSLFRTKNVWVSNGIRDLKNQKSNTRIYRQIFDENNLPDVYNALTYWRFCKEAEQFFITVKDLFNNWKLVQNNIKLGKDQPVNTDLAYALAIDMLGKEDFITPGVGPSMVHMKPSVIKTNTPDWHQELSWEIVDGIFRVNGLAQTGFVHYHRKELAEQFGKYYG
jgi:hypothetical protein